MTDKENEKIKCLTPLKNSEEWLEGGETGETWYISDSTNDVIDPIIDENHPTHYSPYDENDLPSDNDAQHYFEVAILTYMSPNSMSTRSISVSGRFIVGYWLILTLLTIIMADGQTIRQDSKYRTSEFLLSKNNNKNVTVFMPDRIYDNCHIGFLIKVRPGLHDAGLSYTNTGNYRTGNIVFRIEEPKFKETFTVRVDDEKFGRESIMQRVCFLHCETIKTVLLSVSSDISEIKDISIEAIEGNDACEESHPKTTVAATSFNIYSSIFVVCLLICFIVVIIAYKRNKLISKLTTKFERVLADDEKTKADKCLLE